jgi:hypothetical protein
MVERGAPTCNVADVHQSNVEHVFCSGLGTCDFTTGQCACFVDSALQPFAVGRACEYLSNKILPRDQIASSTLATAFDSTSDHFHIYAAGQAYQGLALSLRTEKDLSTDFNFIRTEAGATEITTLRGDGALLMHQGNLTINEGSLNIRNSLTVERLGIKILNGGLTGTNTASSGVVGSLLSHSNTRTSALLSLQSPMPSNDAYRFVDFKANYTKNDPGGKGNQIFEVFSNGVTKINQGGLEITEGTMSLKNNMADVETAIVMSTHDYDFDGTVMQMNFAGSVSDYASLGFDFLRGTTTIDSGATVVEQQAINGFGEIRISNALHISDGTFTAGHGGQNISEYIGDDEVVMKVESTNTNYKGVVTKLVHSFVCTTYCFILMLPFGLRYIYIFSSSMLDHIYHRNLGDGTNVRF